MSTPEYNRSASVNPKETVSRTEFNRLEQQVGQLASELMKLKTQPKLEGLDQLMRTNPNTPLAFYQIVKRFGYPSRTTLWEWAKQGRLQLLPHRKGWTTARWLWDAIQKPRVNV